MAAGSFADEYFSYLDTAHGGIAGASAQVVDQKFPERFERWFRLLYDVIRATTPLLHFCLDRLEHHEPSQFHELLRDYMRSRLDDEAGHDTLLLEDLAKVGISEESLKTALPPSPITAMVGSQYYLVDHLHPAVHLGYIGLLEGYPPNLEDVATLVKRAEVGSEPWATYRLHAELDVDHRQDLVKILDSVPDLPWLRRAIIANGIRSAEYYCQALEDLAAADA